MSAPVPGDLWALLDSKISDKIAAYARSGTPRNSSLTGGRQTIKGGTVVVEAADGGPTMYLGAVAPTLPDGTYQPGWILYREDGSIAAALYDPSPDPDGPGGYKQFFAVYDRAGNIVMSDDTDSGLGLARPFVPFHFYSNRLTDTPTITVSATFETLWQATAYKQNPSMYVGAAGVADSGSAGEVRVMVNGVQLGATQAITSTPTSFAFGPSGVAGAAFSGLTVQIQARRTSGAGNVRVVPQIGTGFQS